MRRDGIVAIVKATVIRSMRRDGTAAIVKASVVRGRSRARTVAIAKATLPRVSTSRAGAGALLEATRYRAGTLATLGHDSVMYLLEDMGLKMYVRKGMGNKKASEARNGGMYSQTICSWLHSK